MNVLEFVSFVGDETDFFAPKDSASVAVTLTSSAGRPSQLVADVAPQPDPDPYGVGDRWHVRLPRFTAPGPWTLLFDQDGEDTTYRIMVLPRELRDIPVSTKVVMSLLAEGSTFEQIIERYAAPAQGA